MKNLFIINEEEKNRILNLHESATKRQYLNEQTTAIAKKALTSAERSLMPILKNVFKNGEGVMTSAIKNDLVKKGILSVQNKKFVYNPGKILGYALAIGTTYELLQKWFDTNNVTPSGDNTNWSMVNPDKSYKTGPISYLSGDGQKTSDKKDTTSDKKETTSGKQQPIKVTACPVGSGTTEEVKVFQDWLDSNAKGWLPKYPDGLNKDVKKGYGMCGPNTRKAWVKHKDDYQLQQTVKFVPKPALPGEGDDVVVPEINQPTKTEEPKSYDAGIQSYGVEDYNKYV